MLKFFKLIKIGILLFCLVLLIVGCSTNDTQQLHFTNIPNQVTEGEAFTIKGEYMPEEMEGEKVKLILDIRELTNSTSLKTKKKTLANAKSQSFKFSDIVLNEIEDDIYFEIKLIIDGSFILSIDSASNPSYLANWRLDIKTTYFRARDEDGEPIRDEEGELLRGTWNNYLIDENPFYFALPYRDFYYYVDGSEDPVKKDYYGETDVKNRWIEIRYRNNEQVESIYAQWVDVGPWNYYDPHYVFEYQRPYAELGIDMGWSNAGYRETNKAGLDISPTAMEYLGEQVGKDLIRKGVVELDWRFVEEDQISEGPWLDNISTQKADTEVFNLETETLRTLD